jgi:FKBP-type peptidyl-prolyl cis-trans isomerase FkpA
LRAARGRFSRAILTVTGVLAVGLAACNSDPAGPELEVIEEVTFAPSLGVDLAAMTKLPEGLYIQDRVAGTGPGLAAGDRAWTYYRLWLRDGTIIGADLHTFVVQANPPEVIEGWDIGMEGMAAGGTRLMVIPYQLGYGEQDYQGIPGGSVLVFEVELDSIT